MCSDFSFFLGLVLLIKGSFRIAGRNISKRTGRIIGLLFMLPTLTMMCVVVNFTFSRLSELDLSAIEDPFDPALMNSILQDVLPMVANVQWVLLFVSITVIAFIIWRQPVEPPLVKVAGGRGGALPVAPEYGKVLTTAEVASYLRIPEFEVITLIEDGKLPAARIGSDYRIARSVVEDFLNSSGSDGL